MNKNIKTLIEFYYLIEDISNKLFNRYDINTLFKKFKMQFSTKFNKILKIKIFINDKLLEKSDIDFLKTINKLPGNLIEYHIYNFMKENISFLGFDNIEYYTENGRFDIIYNFEENKQLRFEVKSFLTPTNFTLTKSQEKELINTLQNNNTNQDYYILCYYSFQNFQINIKNIYLLCSNHFISAYNNMLTRKTENDKNNKSTRLTIDKEFLNNNKLQSLFN